MPGLPWFRRPDGRWGIVRAGIGSCLEAAVGTARRTSRRFIDLTRLEPERVLAALREPGVRVNSASRLSSPRRWRSYPWRYDNPSISRSSGSTWPGRSAGHAQRARRRRQHQRPRVRTRGHGCVHGPLRANCIYKTTACETRQTLRPTEPATLHTVSRLCYLRVGVVAGRNEVSLCHTRIRRNGARPRELRFDVTANAIRSA